MLPEYIQKFHQTHPFISFDLRQGDTQHILDLLSSHLIDLGFVRLPVDSSLYDYIAFSNESMILVASPQAISLDNIKELHLTNLKNQPLLIHRRYETIIHDYCHQNGFEPNIFCTSDEVVPLLTWAQLGLGMAIVPEFSINLLSNSALLVKPLVKPTVTTTSALLWLKNDVLSAAATHFINMFQEKDRHHGNKST